MNTAPVLSMLVPTASMLVAQEPGSSKFLTFTSPVKHKGKKIIPGGKLNPKLIGPLTALPWRYEDSVDTAVRELPEETGLTYVHVPTLFMVRLDPHTDMRTVTLFKASDESCDPSVADLKVQACFGCPDYIYLGVGTGTLRSDGRESGEFGWVNIAEPIDPAEFAAGHDVVLLSLRRWWRTGGWNGGLPPTPDECLDYDRLRKQLLQ